MKKFNNGMVITMAATIAAAALASCGNSASEITKNESPKAVQAVAATASAENTAKAAETKVTAEILEQYKGKKQLVFKFKKRKGYKKLNGHRQRLTRVRITAVGPEKYEPKAAPAVAEEAAEAEDAE